MVHYWTNGNRAKYVYFIADMINYITTTLENAIKEMD